MRIVLDTASFVAAVRSADGAAGEVVSMILSGELDALIDLKLSLEYREVALRAEHVNTSALSRDQIHVLIESFIDASEPVEVQMQIRPLSIDPNDNMVLDLAINGRADALVTSNAKHFRIAAKRFGIAVLSPGELLQTIRKGDQYGSGDR